MLLEPRRTEGHAFVILNDDVAGAEVLRELRATGGSIPAIFLSPGPETPAGSTGPRVQHLASPFTLRTLEAAIAQVCPSFSWPGRSK
jgi:hypothetical protein